MTIAGLRKPVENSQQPDSSTDYIYINETVKIFEIEADAGAYRDYLDNTTKYPKEYKSFTAEINVYKKSALDIDELLRQDVIDRLTAEERRVLGLN